MEWKKRAIDTDKVREFSGKFSLDLLSASIFVRRGIDDYEEMPFYLESDIKLAHNPFLFSEIEDVIDRIMRASAEGERVLVYGDRDVDGITATVLMVEELQKLGIEVSWLVPTGDETYGLSLEVIDAFAARDGTLIITVDCGISNYTEIEHARSLGIDTIIIDHHNPKEKIPPAWAIINPKMEDEGYPFRDLAGCAVTSKVIWALEFAGTDLYNTPICLLNVRPGNDTYIIEAVKLVNLIEVERVSEAIVPGVVHLEKTRLPDFFMHQLFVYDEESQTRMLSTLFGENVEISLFDLATEFWKQFPKLSGKSLLQIREMSKTAKYKRRQVEEPDVLINIFLTLFQQKYTELNELYLQNLDLVALGTLADMMPLRNENRILVRSGMDHLNKNPRKGLKELLIKQNLLGKNIGTKDIAWNIAPPINATGRMGVPELAVTLFLSENQDERERLADEIIGKNKERKKLGEVAWNRLLPEAEKSYKELGGKLVYVHDHKLHRGITGIIAARFLRYFRTTAIVISIMDDIAFGSLRSDKGFNVKVFLEKCAALFTDYGGHDFAAGFNMEKEKVEEFRIRMKEVLNTLEQGETEEERIEIDAELPLSYVSPELINIVELFEPYGEGNPPLNFLCKGMVINNAEIIGKGEQKHLRLLLDTGTKKWPAVYWNAADLLNNEFSIGDRVDTVFRLGRNYFQNNENLQLTILDLKR